MTLATTDLRDIGTLITCALRPKLRPAVDPTYRTLLSRYRSEPDFRNAVRSVLDGMDMLVLSDAAELGLILGPRRESLFAARLADVPNTTSVENRLIVGLVMAGIAAYAYPTADSFDDDRVRYVRVGDVERFLRETCESLKRDADEPLDDEALEEAWRVYERMPAVHRPNQGRTAGRLSPACSQYWVSNVLDWLTSQGLARPAERLGAQTYQLLERFRVQVSEMSGHEAYRLLAEARSRDWRPDATVAPDPFDQPTDDPTDDPADTAPGTATDGSTL